MELKLIPSKEDSLNFETLRKHLAHFFLLVFEGGEEAKKTREIERGLYTAIYREDAEK